MVYYREFWQEAPGLPKLAVFKLKIDSAALMWLTFYLIVQYYVDNYSKYYEKSVLLSDLIIILKSIFQTSASFCLLWSHQIIADVFISKRRDLGLVIFLLRKTTIMQTMDNTFSVAVWKHKHNVCLFAILIVCLSVCLNEQNRPL